MSDLQNQWQVRELGPAMVKQYAHAHQHSHFQSKESQTIHTNPLFGPKLCSNCPLPFANQKKVADDGQNECDCGQIKGPPEGTHRTIHFAIIAIGQALEGRVYNVQLNPYKPTIRRFGVRSVERELPFFSSTRFMQVAYASFSPEVNLGKTPDLVSSGIRLPERAPERMQTQQAINSEKRSKLLTQVLLPRNQP